MRVFHFLQGHRSQFCRGSFRRNRRLLSGLFGAAFILSTFLGQSAVAQQAPKPEKAPAQFVANITRESSVGVPPQSPGSTSAPKPLANPLNNPVANPLAAGETPKGKKGAIAPQSQRDRLVPARESSEQLPSDFFTNLSSPEGFARSVPDALKSEAELNRLLPPARFPVSAAKEDIRGVWMTTSDMAVLGDPDSLSFALKQLARLNFNTIYPVVWNGGYTIHPSEVARRLEIPQIYQGTQGQDILANVIEQAHREGISVVPWFEYGMMLPEESELARAHPEWLTKKRNGDSTSKVSGRDMVWLNPLRPEVQQFLTALVEEVAAKYAVDGVQFDDHMSLPKEFGYDQDTLAAYQREFGREAPKNPGNEAWVRWRASHLTTLIGQLHTAVKRHQPDALFSVSPNAYRYAYNNQLQDWLTWVRRGYVDELIVQVYRSDLRGFINLIERPEMREAQKSIATGVGILSGLARRPVGIGQIQKQVRAAQQRGLGVSFFFYNSLWDNAPEPIEERLALFQSLFPNQSLRLARR